jgi:prepilin-type N-terminal cleavage/methylation domain-containing protein
MNRGNKKLSVCMSRGFSLLECLAAISILSLSIVAPLLIASKSLDAAFFEKDRLTAISLAQDAMEFMHNTRDTARLQNQAWANLLSNCQVDPSDPSDLGCIIDTVNSSNHTTKSINGGPTAGPIKYDSATGLYGYKASWVVDSKFTRQAKLTVLLSGQESRLDVTVSWQGNSGVKKSVTISENITNW